MLFVFAEPIVGVPKTEHLFALRQALDPWIDVSDEPAQAGNVDLKQKPSPVHQAPTSRASRCEHRGHLSNLRQILHPRPHPGARRYRSRGWRATFGVALHRRGRPLEQVIGGKQLAQALRAEGSSGSNRSEPLVVTLAMCDSGHRAPCSFQEAASLMICARRAFPGFRIAVPACGPRFGPYSGVPLSTAHAWRRSAADPLRAVMRPIS